MGTIFNLHVKRRIRTIVERNWTAYGIQLQLARLSRRKRINGMKVMLFSIFCWIDFDSISIHSAARLWSIEKAL